MKTILDDLLPQVVNLYDLPGLAVGIVQRDQLVYARGFGVRDLTTREPITPSSMFLLASISKTFTATAAMQLIESGRLSLDTPLVDCLPGFKLADDRFTRITLQQMLSHTSGLPDHEDYLWETPQEDEGALTRYVGSLADQKLDFDPGEKYAYSNPAYDVLGEVVARVSGQTFDEYMEEHIFRPLEMKESTFLKTRVSPRLATTPFINVPLAEPSPVYPYNRSHAPSGNLHSNILEMGNWAIANLNRGLFEGRQILSPSIYDLLWTPCALAEEFGPVDSVGLGWFIGSYKSRRAVSFSGGEVGFCTNLVLLPDQSLGVIVLSNTFPAPVDVVTDLALDLMLGLSPRLPRPPVVITLSRVLKEAGMEAALAGARQLQELHPQDYDFNPLQFSDIAYILVEVKKIPPAIDLLKLGLPLHPGSTKLHYILAWAYQAAGEGELAEQATRQCLQINPDHWEATRLLHDLRASQV